MNAVVGMVDVAHHEHLVLDGALTVRNIAAVYAKVADALQHHAAVAIDCDTATEIDLSFVQLLIAARKTASNSGRSLALARPASGALRDALTRGGLLPAAEVAGDDAAFWLRGADPT
jgi:ABC-type transporter Mla MlaB component